jgi:hypothetical protein
MATDVKKLVSDCIASWDSRDPDKILSFFTEDGDWTRPEGVFRGKEELKRYFDVTLSNIKNLKLTVCGNGIITEGNNAYNELMVTGIYMGKKVEFLEIDASECSDGKIKHIRSEYDRLSIAKQAAKGWLAKMMVNSMIKQTERGLH